MRRWLALALVGLSTAFIVLATAQGADAKGILGTGIGPDIGPSLDPFPSVSELLSAVVKGLFGALLKALTPDFLKHADIHTLEWLVALPNVADSNTWPTVGHLQADMVWVAGAMLPTALIIATTRDTALSLTFRAHPGNALLRVVGAVFWLVLYRFAVENALAFVNVLTHTILSWPVVAQGLHRTVLVLFGGSVIAGVGGAFLGLLGLVALFFAISLFALKVMLLMVLAVLYVAGPFLIALMPLPVVGYLNRAWVLAIVGLCLIPLGWCIIFATAGAISLDVTNLGTGAHLGSRTVGAFAALATFYVAFRWPLMVLGHVRASVGGVGVRLGGGSGVGAAPLSNGALAVKAQRARAGLQAAMLAGGRSVGLAAGALGAPSGGLIGAASRRALPHVASAAATGAIALGPPRPPKAPGSDDRLGRVADVLRATPGRMRDAWRTATAPPGQRVERGVPGSSTGKTGRSATATTNQPRPATSSRKSRQSNRAPRSGATAGAAPRRSPAEGRQGSSSAATTRAANAAPGRVRPVPAVQPAAQVAPARNIVGGESPAQRQASAPARPRQPETSRPVRAAPGAPSPAPRKGTSESKRPPRSPRPASPPTAPPRLPRKGRRK